MTRLECSCLADVYHAKIRVRYIRVGIGSTDWTSRRYVVVLDLLRQRQLDHGVGAVSAPPHPIEELLREKLWTI